MTEQPRTILADQNQRQADEIRLAMATCVRDESELIWANLHYHRALGVSKVYVYLDRCTDETLEIVKSIPWAEPIVVAPELAEACVFISSLQRCCMNDCLTRARKDGFDWLLMIDADEFAFANNNSEQDATEPSTMLQRADLRMMLTDLPPEVSLIRLRTLESVPCLMDDSEPFWRQKYFQNRRALKRDIFDPRTGERYTWERVLAHREGKAIVRVDADVESYDSHRWVKNQGLHFPRRPAYISVPTIERGLHFHFWAYSRHQFRDKYRKLAWTPAVWPCGVRVEHPKQSFKELSVSMSKDDLYAYVAEHVFMSEQVLERHVQDGLLVKDDTVQQILEDSGFHARAVRPTERSISTLSLHDVCPSGRVDPPRLSIADCCYGAHEFLEPYVKNVFSPELHDGRYFRWTAPKAEIQLALARENMKLVIEMGELGSLIDPSMIAFAINNRVVSDNDILASESNIAIAISEEMITPGSLQTVRIHAPCLEKSPSRDTRDLGIPIFALRVEPLNALHCSPRQSSHAVASWCFDWLNGFHSEEKHLGDSFRWTKPKADLRLSVEPGEYVLSLNLGRLRSLADGRRVDAVFNGHTLTPERDGAGHDTIAYMLPKTHFEDSRLQKLHICVNALDTSSWDQPDPRELGIPLFGIDLRARTTSPLTIVAEALSRLVSRGAPGTLT